MSTGNKRASAQVKSIALLEIADKLSEQNEALKQEIQALAMSRILTNEEGILIWDTMNDSTIAIIKTMRGVALVAAQTVCNCDECVARRARSTGSEQLATKEASTNADTTAAILEEIEADETTTKH